MSDIAGRAVTLIKHNEVIDLEGAVSRNQGRYKTHQSATRRPAR